MVFGEKQRYGEAGEKQCINVLLSVLDTSSMDNNISLFLTLTLTVFLTLMMLRYVSYILLS